jgi:hypothetical protein
VRLLYFLRRDRCPEFKAGHMPHASAVDPPICFAVIGSDTLEGTLKSLWLDSKWI